MKLELKHIAPYLPYGLKCQYYGIVDALKYNRHCFGGSLHEDNGMGLKIGLLKEIKIYKKYWKAYVGKYPSHLKSSMNGNDIYPILRPLSDLTKEIEHNGERFVPYIELLRVCNFDIDHMSTKDIEYYKPDEIEFECILLKSYYEIEKLFEWHFDVFGLIPEGLAIDINTLNK